MVLSDLDRDLLNRCLASAEGAWESFVERYLALITHVVAATAEAKFSALPTYVRDDIVAEILLAIVDDDFAILRRFRGQSSLGTYLVVVSRRIAARRLSKIPLSKKQEQEEFVEPTQNSQLEDTEEVQTLLGKLEQEEAQAIRLFHLEHRSYGDISRQMGIPENSVGPLLSRARQNMRSLRGT